MVGQKYSPVPPSSQLGFLGVQLACLLRCSVYLFWGADLWLRHSRWNRGLLHCRWILYQLSHQDHENPDPPVFGHSVVCFSPGSDSCLIRYLKDPAAAVSSSPSRSPLRKEPCLLRQPKEPWTPFPTDQSRERGLWVGPGSGGLGRGLTWAPSCTRPPASLSRSPSQGHPARRAQIPAVASSSPL